MQLEVLMCTLSEVGASSVQIDFDIHVTSEATFRELIMCSGVDNNFISGVNFMFILLF